MQDGADRALLQAIVAQFVGRSGHRPSEIQQFERLVSGLFGVMDDDAALSVAEALCRHPETPSALIARLLERGGACARVALELAVGAPLENSAGGGRSFAELATAIARRPELTRDAISALASGGEWGALSALASNRQIRLDSASLRTLAQVARDELSLARVLLDREDLDIDPEPLFLAATQSERSAIMLAACRAALASGAGEGPPRSDGGLAARLETLAIAKDYEAMIARLAEALEANKARVRKIFFDEGGEALALAFVMLAIGVEAATRIFIYRGLAAGRDVAQMRMLRNLMRSTPPRAAARIIAAINGTARLDREPGRRMETPTQIGAWRRANGARNGSSVARQVKLDQTA